MMDIDIIDMSIFGVFSCESLRRMNRRRNCPLNITKLYRKVIIRDDCKYVSLVSS